MTIELTEERKPAWRRACLAYREMRQAGARTVQQVLPLLSWKEVSAEAVNAVAYATKYHSEWFWRGTQHIRKSRGTTH